MTSPEVHGAAADDVLTTEPGGALRVHARVGVDRRVGGAGLRAGCGGVGRAVTVVRGHPGGAPHPLLDHGGGRQERRS
ncbi:hypothetical protein [Friedmanniella luteola]|uniref:hypothetical protein n=1 Tax=Friedmanniella luteola TaxID=546871 RepID=UPI0012FDEA32|nr:hypothetical protein [Friedmanniella luteola]